MSLRVHRVKVGLTYSCPKDKEDNPIPGMEYLLELFKTYGMLTKYIISTELHKDGRTHYHAYIRYEQKLDTINPKFFDTCGVHPNVNNPNEKGWSGYCGKQGQYITNFWEPDVWEMVMKARTWKEAAEILWTRKPGDMMKHADTYERNWKKRFIRAPEPTVYYGPYPYRIPDSWDWRTHTLVIQGAPGMNKTQWLKYELKHRFGSICYIKGSLSGLKKFEGEDAILLDDVNIPEHFSQFNALMDVENGGAISVSPTGLYDFNMPYGTPRIFITNGYLLDVLSIQAGDVTRRYVGIKL